MRNQIPLAVILSLVALCTGLAYANETSEQLALLNQHGIETDTPGILAYVRRLQPNEKLQVEITALVRQLGDTDFAAREAAFAKLPTFGNAARGQLEAATKSDDPETVWRAGKLLARLNSADESALRGSLVVAAMEVLQTRRDPQAAPVILATIGLLTENPSYNAACQALWACTDASHAEDLEKAIGDVDPRVRVAAVVALEVAAGDDSLPTIAPLLKSDNALLRLAAARALVDRQPRDSVETLIPLVASEEQDIAWQADALLQMKTGHQAEVEDQRTLGDAWKQWSADSLAAAKWDVQLGTKRLDLSAGRSTLKESFARDQPSLAKGYGPFQYEADNGGAAKVVDGKLHISGGNPEGDQRLYITSQRMIGRDRWPDALEVSARLTAATGGETGRHVGVSIGRVKVLFHAGYRGGGFRAETTDEHDYIFNNETMSFTPASDVLHEMTIHVAKTDTGANFDVTVNNGNGGKPFTKKFVVTREQLGDYDRIGLERSGRSGGDGVFDSVSIRLGR